MKRRVEDLESGTLCTGVSLPDLALASHGYRGFRIKTHDPHGLAVPMYFTTPHTSQSPTCKPHQEHPSYVPPAPIETTAPPASSSSAK